MHCVNQHLGNNIVSMSKQQNIFVNCCRPLLFLEKEAEGKRLKKEREKNEVRKQQLREKEDKRIQKEKSVC